MNSAMVHHERYVAGWLDSTVHDLVANLTSNFASMKFALITCLDSDTNPAALLESSPELNALDPRPVPLGDALWLPTAQLVECDSRHRLFHGFDELWFSPSPPATPKPDSAWIVGPNRISQGNLDRLGEWMTSNDCSLGLGDGDGLNFVVKAMGLMRHLLAQSMTQPEPRPHSVL